MPRYSICLLLLLIIAVQINAQNYRKSQEQFLEAEYFLMFEDYSDALPYYMELFREFPENYNLAHKIGLCYLNIPGQKAEAIPYLEKAARNVAADYREGSLKQMTAPYIAWYDLATAYRINYQFEKAKDAFRRYSETLLKEDTENILFVEHQVNVCDYAISMVSQPVEFSEVNIGGLFNDSRSNFNPLISPDGTTFAFMSSLKFYDAVFISKKNKGKWSNPLNITPEIKSDGDMYISCLTEGGQDLFMSKIKDDESDIYVSHFDGTKYLESEKLDKNINSKYWDTHAYCSEDGSVLVFASDRPGGFGGLDIYISEKLENGKWGKPRNLGPEINTPFNEDRPFLLNNGNTIFFCSQGHQNMGGFDIFRSEKLQNGHWNKPANIGYPVNTPDDDTFFMPVNGGKSAYISVFRPGKGFGAKDIYKITFK